MKILYVNKFLYPKGGCETYTFKLAQYFEQKGHQIQYFGMTHPHNIVGNEYNLGVSPVDFGNLSLMKMFYPFRIIYSVEAKRKIGKVIHEFRPDLVHINNFNFQITPSILYEIKKSHIPVVMTLHDFQLVCPNHMMYLEHEKRICESCKDRKYRNCIKNKCIHHSRLKSIVAYMEALLYYKLKTYDKYINYYISPSRFLKNKMVEFGEPSQKIFVLHNFIEEQEPMLSRKKDYVLYFGRLSVQKGIRTFIEACKIIPEVKFVFAGSGELESELHGIENVRYVGFKQGSELNTLICEALFSVIPSEWYENCPMSILESMTLGTPVIGSNIGGIPELIQDQVDGLLFQPGDVNELANKIRLLYTDKELRNTLSQRCIQKVQAYSLWNYYQEIQKIYHRALTTSKGVE